MRPPSIGGHIPGSPVTRWLSLTSTPRLGGKPPSHTPTWDSDETMAPNGNLIDWGPGGKSPRPDEGHISSICRPMPYPLSSTSSTSPERGEGA
eukprot:50019-Amphidinium_carterae.4